MQIPPCTKRIERDLKSISPSTQPCLNLEPHLSLLSLCWNTCSSWDLSMFSGNPFCFWKGLIRKLFLYIEPKCCLQVLHINPHFLESIKSKSNLFRISIFKCSVSLFPKLTLYLGLSVDIQLFIGLSVELNTNLLQVSISFFFLMLGTSNYIYQNWSSYDRIKQNCCFFHFKYSTSIFLNRMLESS